MENSYDIIATFQSIKTPAFVCDENKLLENVEICHSIGKKTKAKIILALKGFSLFSTFPKLNKKLNGCSSSSLNETKLAYETFNKTSIHMFSPAYIDQEIPDILSMCSHISFNSLSQWHRFKHVVLKSAVSPGLRINPEHSEVSTALYDPCAPNSRLGVTHEECKKFNFEGIEGLHSHTLCQSQFPELERTVEIIEEKFGRILKTMSWLNLGGGHHLTDPNYDIDGLCSLINRLQNTYNLSVILEPGEAIALNAGYLVSTVLDIIEKENTHAILDTSASTHMPDVLEMPYKPYILNSEEENDTNFTYQLSGLTCLAGDIIGTYSFNKPLKVGDKLIFTDMAHYTMVKTTTFNGVNLPDILILDNNKNTRFKKTFNYNDFKMRLS